MFIAVVCVTVAGAARAETASLTATADSYLRGGGNKNQNQGIESFLQVQSTGTNRALVRIDQSVIVSTIGPGTFQSATLELYLGHNGNNWGTGHEIDLHRVTQAWTEAGVTWNCPDDTNTGNPDPDCPAQWDGGTFDGTPSGSYVQMNGVVNTVISFDVTADVAAFLGGTPNNGWLLKKLEENFNGEVQYTAREGAMANRPRLVLQFFLPPTPTPTVTPTPIPPGCSATPRSGCRQALQIGTSSILMKRNPSNPAADRVSWKWTKGDATDVLDFGNPALSGGPSYSLCVYDSTANVPSLFFGAIVPPGGTCVGQPCWKPTGSTGFKYLDNNASADGVRNVSLKAGSAGRAKIIVKGKGPNLVLPPVQLNKDPVVIVQLESTSGLCWESRHSTASRNEPTQFRAKNDAPLTPGPTNTATPTIPAGATATGTETMTPMPTPTSSGPVHHCVLTGGGASKIGLFTEALGAPISFNISGTLDIGATGASATCDIVTLNPVNIIGIGFVCISPGPPCPTATRWCGPGAGPALGIDSFSDGTAGACTSNADCATICAGPTLCNGAGNVLTAACTGFCTAGTQPTCNLDADCLPSDGACNGPDPVMPNQNICQCSCINNAAHGASDPGDLQCNLASNLIVEMASPCNGTDILINVGDTCIPVSTQRATGLISNSNFNACGVPPCLVPVVPNINDQSGTPIACATMDSSTLTGFVGVGAVNFFGSTLGDLSVGLKATCQ